MCCLPSSSGHMEEDKMGSACGMYGREKNYVQGFGGKTWNKRSRGNLGIYYKVINIKMHLMFVWPCFVRKTMWKTNKMQQLFRLSIFLNQPYMFRATNTPILRSTFWLYMQLLVQYTYTVTDLPKAVYTVKKCSWGWANLSSETCRAELKRLINEKVVASCWSFTSLY